MVKRLTALVLVLMMVFSLTVFAEENEKMKEVLSSVKERIQLEQKHYYGFLLLILITLSNQMSLPEMNLFQNISCSHLGEWFQRCLPV